MIGVDTAVHDCDHCPGRALRQVPGLRREYLRKVPLRRVLGSSGDENRVEYVVLLDELDLGQAGEQPLHDHRSCASGHAHANDTDLAHLAQDRGTVGPEEPLSARRSDAGAESDEQLAGDPLVRRLRLGRARGDSDRDDDSERCDCNEPQRDNA